MDGLARPRIRLLAAAGLGCLLAFGGLLCPRLAAQENPLGDVHTAAPPTPAAPKDTRPVVKDEEVTRRAASAPGSKIQVNVNLVLVPMTVTDPLNRLVTGLERENFFVYDNNAPQKIKTFSTQDAPLTIGIVFDLSGSMQSKFVRARKALSEFLRTCNPQDEFFVVGFNDKPAVIVDYTSDVDDVEARMVMLKPANRTALIDAVYLGVNKLKTAKYERKALLIISDGGDNRSRYTEGELRRSVRESEVQIYSIGIFDMFAPTRKSAKARSCCASFRKRPAAGCFRWSTCRTWPTSPRKISQELRNEYVIGYTPSDTKRDGNWRKLKMHVLAAAAGASAPDGAQSRGVLCAVAVERLLEGDSFHDIAACMVPGGAGVCAATGAAAASSGPAGTAQYPPGTAGHRPRAVA